jgi:hypothetical protein
VKVVRGLSALLFGTLVACGGGGGTASGGGGGGGGNTGGGGTTPTAANVAPIVVDQGPSGASGVVNTPYVTVKVCTPDGISCQTIDHITVDTQSSGLRVIGSVLTLNLPPEKDANGNPIADCGAFADGYTWGPVKLANVTVASLQATNIPVHVIGDSAYPDSTTPSDCKGSNKNAENTVASFGANGILGVSVFKEDCGPGCETQVIPATYYVCPTPASCTGSVMARSLQLQNPVPHFVTDNNGVIVQLPAISPSGAASAAGSLIFGIDTESNNSLGSRTILALDSTGDFPTQFNGKTLTDSFIDSGSNGLFFPNSGISSLQSCSTQTGFYCPSSTQQFTAMMQSAANASITANVPFNVANADTLLNNNPTGRAFNDLAGAAPATVTGFDWGLPFFYGRTVYVAIEGQTTSGGTGPFTAF